MIKKGGLWNMKGKNRSESKEKITKKEK